MADNTNPSLKLPSISRINPISGDIYSHLALKTNYSNNNYEVVSVDFLSNGWLNYLSACMNYKDAIPS